MRKLIITLAAVAFSLSAMAYDFIADGIKYTFVNNQTAVEIGMRALENDSRTQLVIPDAVTYDGVDYPVICIDYGAFKNCANLLDVTFGRNLQIVYMHAFEDCGAPKRVVWKPINCDLSDILIDAPAVKRQRVASTDFIGCVGTGRICHLRWR